MTFLLIIFDIPKDLIKYIFFKFLKPLDKIHIRLRRNRALACL